MAEIKLYGNTVNGDGKYIVSPFDIAAPKADGINSYVADDKDPSKNIVSYINSKVSGLTSDVNTKVGIKSVTATVADITSASFKTGATISPTITVTGNDGVSKSGPLGISVPPIDSILANSSTSYANVQNAIKTINAASGAGSFRQGDADTLASAQKYADDKVSKLGYVYHIEGTKSLTEIKALTNVVKGSVYNVSEKFIIDEKPYPEYTNIVFLTDAKTVTYDSTTGFDGDVVDALGGVQDLTAYSLKSNTVQTVNVIDSDVALSDTGVKTTIATVGAGKENGTTQAPVSVTAKLPTTLAKVSSPKLETSANSLKLSGLTNLSGTTVTPLSYKSVTATVTSTAGSASDSQKLSISVGGELGSTGTSATVSLTKAASTAYGVVKTGDGINNTGGVISVPKNTFNTSKYLSVSYTTGEDKGQNFILDVVCNTATPGTSIIPLQKADASTLGIKINTSNTYIKLKQSTLDLGIDETALTTKINSIETRITALETLLSLA